MKKLFIGLLISAWAASFIPSQAYEDPETGTFLTRDPAGMIDGPNEYTYVKQNPWTSFDPEGLETKQELQDDNRALNTQRDFYNTERQSLARDKMPTKKVDDKIAGIDKNISSNDKRISNIEKTAKQIVKGTDLYLSVIVGDDSDTKKLRETAKTNYDKAANLDDASDFYTKNKASFATAAYITYGSYLLSPAVSLEGKAALAAEETTTIYRAVSSSELNSINASRDFLSSPSMGGKYFALTHEGVKNFANSAFNASENMTITSTRVPSSFLDNGTLFNDPGGAGASVHFSDDFLPALNQVKSPIVIH